ncbi:MAG: hypothetical protein ACFFCS_10025 [Candidatus Hodarchaeota archaeon]
MTSPHPKRKEGLTTAVTFNQIRNAIGIITEIMEEVYGKEIQASAVEKEKAIIERLRDMGKRVVDTYINYWQPGYSGLDQMLIQIYHEVFNARVQVMQPADFQTVRKDFKGKKIFIVETTKCPLCKAKRATNIAGCEVLLGAVEAFFKELHERLPNMEVPLLKAGDVVETKTRGDSKCVHRYILERL